MYLESTVRQDYEYVCLAFRPARLETGHRENKKSQKTKKYQSRNVCPPSM